MPQQQMNYIDPAHNWREEIVSMSHCLVLTGVSCNGSNASMDSNISISQLT